MSNKNKPRIGDEDQKLLVRIAKHGFVDMDYVYHFMYLDRTKRTVQDRIRQLEIHGYLASISTFLPADYTSSGAVRYKILTLGVVGIRLMKYYGFEVIDNLQALKASSPFRMYHQCQLSMLCDRITESYDKSIDSNYEVYKIYNERDCINDRITMQPDALMVFKPKKQANKDIYIGIFIEMERSYASELKVEKKLVNYQMAIRKNIYKEKFNLNIVAYRVLFVSKTNAQYKSLVDKIRPQEEITKSINVLMAKYQDVVINPRDKIYESVDGNKYRLFSKM